MPYRLNILTVIMKDISSENQKSDKRPIQVIKAKVVSSSVATGHAIPFSASGQLFLSNFNGDETHIDFAADIVNRHSIVVLSICELSQPSGEPLDFPTPGESFLTISTVVPQDDHRVRVTITNNQLLKGSTLNIRISGLIYNMYPD
jgi:hypothetical protein